MRHRFKASEYKRLTHHIEVLAERIQQFDAMCGRERFQVGIIPFGSERVVENFVKSESGELLTNEPAEIVGSINRGLERERRVKRRRHLHIIVSVDTENIFDYIARALYVDTVGRHFKRKHTVLFAGDFYFHGFEYRVNGILGYFFADKAIDLSIGKLDVERREFAGFHIEYRADNLASGHFLDKQGREFEYIHRAVGVDATFITE